MENELQARDIKTLNRVNHIHKNTLGNTTREDLTKLKIIIKEMPVDQ
jgi:hypothetical protein